MALMNGARLGIAAQSVGISQMAYNEALAYAVSQKRLVLTSRVGESERISYVLFCVRAERSYKAANCVMSQLMLRDATKAPELFEKSMKVYLNLAERACAEFIEAKSPSTTTS